MDDLYDSLGNLLCEGSRASRPFLALLPFLPSQAALESEFITPRQRQRLASKGLSSGAALHRWTPQQLQQILALPHYTESDFLGNLVRGATVLPRTNSTYRRGPAETFQFWFNGLGIREKDVVRELACATHPVPIDSLAAKHGTLPYAIRKLLNRLPNSLQSAIDGDPHTSRQVQALQSDISTPASIPELTLHHPWITQAIEGDISAISLLCSLKWPGSLREGWVCAGDFDHHIHATLATLAMEPGESMEISTVKRLLGAAGAWSGGDDSRIRRWLLRCGLKTEGDQVRSPLPDRAPLDESVAVVPVSSDAEPLHFDPIATQSDLLMNALRKLGKLTSGQESNNTLGSLLKNADLLDGEVGSLARKIRDARISNDGVWQFDSRTSNQPSQHESYAEMAGPADSGKGNEYDHEPPRTTSEPSDHASLASRVIEVLSHSSAPLSVREIAERLQVEVSDLYLARTFFAYDRVKISAAGTWCLITSDGDESGVTPTVSGSTNDSVRTGSSTEESTDESQESGREEWLVRLRHEIEGILRQASSAMSTSQIADRLARKVRLKTLRQQLGGDPRFRYIGDDRWALKRREARGAGATPTVASIITGQRGHQALPTAVPPPRGRAAVGKLEGVLDTLAETLRKVGHPLSTQILRDRAGGAIDTGVLKQVLSTDARFHLSDRDAWALTEWDMPSYKPIKDLIGDMVDAHGGAVPASEVVKKLTTNFTLKESSLRQAMSSPPFSVKNGFVRRLIDVEEEQLRQARAAQNSTGHQGSDVPTADELVADMGLDF